MIEAALIGLAAWRLAFLLVWEEGPFKVFESVRKVLGVYGEIPEGRVASFLPQLLSCVHCMGFWMVLIAVGLWHVEPWIVYGLAAWGVSSLAEFLRSK